MPPGRPEAVTAFRAERILSDDGRNITFSYKSKMKRVAVGAQPVHQEQNRPKYKAASDQQLETSPANLTTALGLVGCVHNSRDALAAERAQRPAPRDARIATTARWRGSLQRISLASILIRLSSPSVNRAEPPTARTPADARDHNSVALKPRQ